MMKRLLILLIAAIAVLAGCQRRDLEYPEKGVNLNLHLKIRLNVSVNGKIEELPEPEMMRVMFFDPNTFELVSENYLPAGGGRVVLAPGKYKFIAYNFDTESTLLRNDRNFYSIEAYTNEISTALKSTLINSIRYGKRAGNEESTDDIWDAALQEIQNNPIIYEPDHLFVSHEDVEVLDIQEDQTIEASAETIIETWKISVQIKNRQYMASARAMITGQIASNFIGYPKEEGKTNTDVTLMFDMAAGTDDDANDIVVGTFNTFGKNPSVESRLWLTIIIKTIDGDTLEWHRDITDEFYTFEAVDEQIIRIVEEIEVPEPENPSGGGGGGFQPGVEDWEEENIPINL